MLPSRTTTGTPPPDCLIGEDSLLQVIQGNHRLSFSDFLLNQVSLVPLLTRLLSFRLDFVSPVQRSADSSRHRQIVDRSDGCGMVAHSSEYSTLARSFTRLDRFLFPASNSGTASVLAETRAQFPEGVNQFFLNNHAKALPRRTTSTKKPCLSPYFPAFQKSPTIPLSVSLSAAFPTSCRR